MSIPISTLDIGERRHAGHEPAGEAVRWRSRGGPTGAPEGLSKARSFRPPRRPDAPTPTRSRRAATSKRRSLPALACALVALGLGMAAVAFKESVVRAYPPSANAFARIGLPVNLRGLAFEGVGGAIATENGDTVLTVGGRIGNLRETPVALPALRLTLRDKDGRDLYHWTAPAPRPVLDARGSVSFRTRLAAPPEQARDIMVAFADAPPPAAAPPSAGVPGPRRPESARAR